MTACPRFTLLVIALGLLIGRPQSDPNYDFDGDGVVGSADCDAEDATIYEGAEDTYGDGNLDADPEYLDTSSADHRLWDIHLSTTSSLVDAGDPGILDPDFSASDIGAHGGPYADERDLDLDGYPVWWQPGVYDQAAYPGLGWTATTWTPQSIQVAAANPNTGLTHETPLPYPASLRQPCHRRWRGR